MGIFRIIKTSKYLELTYGGKWKFDRKSKTWMCNDGRYANYRLTGRDINGEYTGESSLYVYSPQ